MMADRRPVGQLKPWRVVRVASACFAFALLYVPLICLVVWSFRVRSGVDWNWGVDNWLRVFSTRDLLWPLVRSLGLAMVSAVVAGALGTAAALAVERTRWRVRSLLGVFALMTLTLPEIVMGIGLLVWFSFLNLKLGFWTLLIAHVTICVGYVFVSVLARIRQVDPKLEEAAIDLGADESQTFWLVTLPSVRPAVISGALLAFVISFDDFLVSFFTTGVGWDTLPIKLYSMIKFGMDPAVFALTSLLLLLTSLVTLIVWPQKINL
jgi:spermidine/putrescine transport system permease protein